MQRTLLIAMLLTAFVAVSMVAAKPVSNSPVPGYVFDKLDKSGPAKSGLDNNGGAKPQPFLTGGPDAENYRWIDSDDGGAGHPVYNWYSGSLPNTGSGDDSYFTFTLPWAFYYRGSTYTTVYISQNGSLNFAAGSGYNSYDFPSTYDDQLAACPYSRDLYSSGGARIIRWGVIGTTPNRQFVATWDSVYNYGTPTTWHNFQVFLNEADSSVVFQYKSSSGWAGGHTGSQNSARTIGLNIPAAQLKANYAIKFYYVPPLNNDVGVSAITAPSLAQWPGRPFAPACRVSNYGLNPQNNFAVRCTVYGPGNVVRYANSFTVTTSIPSSGTQDVTFPTFTPTVPNEAITVACRTVLTGDQVPSNDRGAGSYTLNMPDWFSGPNAGNMYWIDCDTAGGPAYSWVDISGSGTSVPFTSYDDSYYAVTLPFNFTFYGNSFSSMSIGSNGLLTFDASPPNAYNPYAIPNASTPNNVIAPWWADMQCYQLGRVKYATLGTTPNRTFVVTYDSVTHYGQTLVNGGYSFQVIMYETSNNVVLQYRRTAIGNASYDYGVAASTGIENSTGTIGLG